MAGQEPGADGVLRGGQFFSHVARQERHEHVTLSELWQPAPGEVPYHEHEIAYVTLVVSGDYAEGGRRTLTELPAFSVVYNPSGVAHVSRVGSRGMKLFTIECWPELLARLDVRPPDHPVVDPGSGGMLWPALSAFTAFRSGTADDLILESHLAEILGSLAGPVRPDASAPAWFGRVKDRLHAEFRGPIRIHELALDAGVHPVHLARVFRAQARQSPGDYVQRLRVRAACDLLRRDGAPLAAIAAECGFADQSHLTRTFKKLVGITPARFRSALRGSRASSA